MSLDGYRLGLGLESKVIEGEIIHATSDAGTLIAAAFAGVAAGFGVNFIITPTDAVLTERSARMKKATK